MPISRIGACPRAGAVCGGRVGRAPPNAGNWIDNDEFRAPRRRRSDTAVYVSGVLHRCQAALHIVRLQLSRMQPECGACRPGTDRYGARVFWLVAEPRRAAGRRELRFHRAGDDLRAMAPRKGRRDSPRIPGEPRAPSGWLAENSFELPQDAPPGTYVFVNRIQADDGSEDRRDAVFILTQG